MNRRAFLGGAAAGSAISMLDWLGWFRRFGVPGTRKSLGFAEAAAQAAAEPRFLITWCQEGGWDSYSMFGPVDTPNHAAQTFVPGAINPSPAWSDQFYRPTGYPDASHHPSRVEGAISYGHLATDGLPLFPDLCVLASLHTVNFHSGGRWYSHYGNYTRYTSVSAKRESDERTYTQAFCEAYGASFPVSHVAWHRWMADGELSDTLYPEGTGYYEKLGPAYAHTTYGRTPAEMRARLSTLGSVVGSPARMSKIRAYVDDLNANFLRGKDSESIRAFDAALKVHQQYTSGAVTVDPATLFTDPALKAHFGVLPQHELAAPPGSRRSKNSPETNVQAMMTYELMTKGLSVGFWIENQVPREFDTHKSRELILKDKGHYDQLPKMRKHLWTPLKALVAKLKSTPYGNTGKSYYDFTTIILSSEMSRTLNGNVADVLASTEPETVKYAKVMEQDCCQHWGVNSVALLGGTVKGGTQFGRVGSSTLEGIPLHPVTGALDPAFNPVTGVLISGRTSDPAYVVPEVGHVYATALHLSGFSLDAANLVVPRAAGHSVGRNGRPALKFMKR